MPKFSLNVNIDQLLNITKLQPDQLNTTFIFNIDNNQVLIAIKNEDVIDFIKYLVKSAGKPD